MWTTSRVSEYAGRGANQLVFTWRAVNAQPSWAIRATAVLVAILAIPLFMLVMLLIVAALVFLFALGAVAALFGKLRGAFPRDDGRRNVRVIERRD